MQHLRGRVAGCRAQGCPPAPSSSWSAAALSALNAHTLHSIPHSTLSTSRTPQVDIPARRQVLCTAAGEPAYPYSSGDGRTQKATLEHIFSADAAEHFQEGASGPLDAAQAPWGVGWQMNERNLLWNDDIKLRFVKRIASQELGISEEELEERLQTLSNLLPDLAPRLIKAPPQQLAQLAAGTHAIAARLLQLKAIFPQANISQLIEKRLSLLLEDDMADVEAAAVRLRQLLPHIHVDTFVEAHPQVLEVADFELALEDAKRLMPHIDVARALRSSPELILSLQKGKHLIPYDEPWPIKKN